jgi:hypothetical protein
MVYNNPKVCHINADLNRIVTDQAAHVVYVNTAGTGVQTVTHGGNNETVNWQIFPKLPRNISALGLKLTGFKIRYMVTAFAITSITPVLWRNLMLADGVNTEQIAVTLEAVTAFDVAVDAAVQCAEYRIPVASQQYDSVGINGAATHKILDGEDPNYWLNLEEVVGGLTGKLVLYGVTFIYEEI